MMISCILMSNESNFLIVECVCVCARMWFVPIGHTFQGLRPNTQYSYRIRVVAVPTKVYGNYCDEVHETTVPIRKSFKLGLFLIRTSKWMDSNNPSHIYFIWYKRLPLISLCNYTLSFRYGVLIDLTFQFSSSIPLPFWFSVSVIILDHHLGCRYSQTTRHTGSMLRFWLIIINYFCFTDAAGSTHDNLRSEPSERVGERLI